MIPEAREVHLSRKDRKVLEACCRSPFVRDQAPDAGSLAASCQASLNLPFQHRGHHLHAQALLGELGRVPGTMSDFTYRNRPVARADRRMPT